LNKFLDAGIPLYTLGWATCTTLRILVDCLCSGLKWRTIGTGTDTGTGTLRQGLWQGLWDRNGYCYVVV